jgi:excisionase family DNA binding protein
MDKSKSGGTASRTLSADGLGPSGEQLQSQRQTYSVEQVARLLGLGRSSVYKLCGSGEIPGSFRLGGRLLVSKAKLDAFLEDPSNAA